MGRGDSVNKKGDDIAYQMDELEDLINENARVINSNLSSINHDNNANDIDEAVNMARDNGMEFELNSSSRWNGSNDPYRPTKSEYRIDRW